MDLKEPVLPEPVVALCTRPWPARGAWEGRGEVCALVGGPGGPEGAAVWGAFSSWGGVAGGCGGRRCCLSLCGDGALPGAGLRAPRQRAAKG